ncbi:MAG: TIGR00730 family Rossman fold protein [Alphaproteobacteria bacterium]
MTALSSLCVYCGSAVGVDPAHRDAAARLGELMAARGVRLVYGGGAIGLMGVLADAVLAGGGSVTGIIPRHLEAREVGHRTIGELIVVDNMHERKQRMFELADAFAALPGGLGTLDETVEIITWRQLGLHDKPIVLIDNAGYWAPLLGLVGHAVAAGFARPEATRLFTVVARVDQLFDAIAAQPAPATPARDDLL